MTDWQRRAAFIATPFIATLLTILMSVFLVTLLSYFDDDPKTIEWSLVLAAFIAPFVETLLCQSSTHVGTLFLTPCRQGV